MSWVIAMRTLNFQFVAQSYHTVCFGQQCPEIFFRKETSEFANPDHHLTLVIVSKKSRATRSNQWRLSQKWPFLKTRRHRKAILQSPVQSNATISKFKCSLCSDDRSSMIVHEFPSFEPFKIHDWVLPSAKSTKLIEYDVIWTWWSWRSIFSQIGFRFSSYTIPGETPNRRQLSDLHRSVPAHNNLHSCERLSQQ
jgi:hypothetical protein